MIRTPPKAKDTPAYVTSLKARRNDRDLGSRKSSGPAVIVPHQQAGHMTAADQIVRCCKKALANRGRPHMTGRRQRKVSHLHPAPTNGRTAPKKMTAAAGKAAREDWMLESQAPGVVGPFAGMDVPWLLRMRSQTRRDHPFLIWAPFDAPARIWSYGEFHERVG